MIHKINKTYDVRVTPNDKHEDGWYDIPDLDRFDAEGKGLVKAFGLFAVCKAIHTLQKAKEPLTPQRIATQLMQGKYVPSGEELRSSDLEKYKYTSIQAIYGEPLEHPAVIPASWVDSPEDWMAGTLHQLNRP